MLLLPQLFCAHINVLALSPWALDICQITLDRCRHNIIGSDRSNDGDKAICINSNCPCIYPINADIKLFALVTVKSRIVYLRLCSYKRFINNVHKIVENIFSKKKHVLTVSLYKISL